MSYKLWSKGEKKYKKSFKTFQDGQAFANISPVIVLLATVDDVSTSVKSGFSCFFIAFQFFPSLYIPGPDSETV